MHVLLKDKSLKRFLEQGGDSLPGAIKISELNSSSLDADLANSKHPLVYFSLVSIISLLLIVFMGVPMYIMVNFEGDWNSSLQRSEVEFVQAEAVSTASVINLK